MAEAPQNTFRDRQRLRKAAESNSHAVKESSELGSVREVVQLASASVIGFSTAAYVIGLLIVNLHLALYGVSGLEVNRADYVIAGFCFMLLVLSAALCLSNLKRRIRAARTSRNKLAAVFGLLIAILCLALPMLIFISIANHPLDTLRNAWACAVTAIVLYVCAVSASAIGRYCRDLWVLYGLKRIPMSEKGKHQSDIELPGNAHKLIWLVILGLFIGLYTLTTYTEIQLSFGGAREDRITLAPTAEGLAVSKMVGFPIDKAGRVGPVYLIEESEKELVILDHPPSMFMRHPPIARLKRELFDAIAPFAEPEMYSVLGTSSPPAPTTTTSGPASPIPTPPSR